jgi:hypothetical protein
MHKKIRHENKYHEINTKIRAPIEEKITSLSNFDFSEISGLTDDQQKSKSISANFLLKLPNNIQKLVRYLFFFFRNYFLSLNFPLSGPSIASNVSRTPVSIKLSWFALKIWHNYFLQKVTSSLFWNIFFKTWLVAILIKSSVSAQMYLVLQLTIVSLHSCLFLNLTGVTKKLPRYFFDFNFLSSNFSFLLCPFFTSFFRLGR